MKRLRWLAFASPALVFLSVVFSIMLSSYDAKRVIGGFFLMLAALFLGRFAARIARGQEAKFVNVRVRPNDEEEKKLFLMWVAIIGEVVLAAMPFVSSLRVS